MFMLIHAMLVVTSLLNMPCHIKDFYANFDLSSIEDLIIHINGGFLNVK